MKMYLLKNVKTGNFFSIESEVETDYSGEYLGVNEFLTDTTATNSERKYCTTNKSEIDKILSGKSWVKIDPQEKCEISDLEIVEIEV